MKDRFSVAGMRDLELERSAPLSEFYVLSPFVWPDEGEYHLLLRAVNRSEIPSEKVARIYHGAGLDAVRFGMDKEPVLAPGPEKYDMDGCEDPTVALVDGVYHVFYSGWNETAHQGQLLLASGSSVHRLAKRGPVFSDSSRYRNVKEATVVCAADRTWRLFFEFAEDDRSKIGVASAPAVTGPWKFEHPPIKARADAWDDWHLSPGPVSMADPQRPIMFYNGANRSASWRIGWIEFDSCFTKSVARGIDPLISPPPKEQPHDTDIAFAASAVDFADSIGLYYTVADRRLVRADVRQLC